MVAIKQTKPCKGCGVTGHTAFTCPRRPRKPMQAKSQLKAKKRMKQRGRQTIQYEKWRDEIAKPFLDEAFGHVCSVASCTETEALQVDHILNRSTHPHLKMSLENVQYLCDPHHRQKTYHERGSLWSLPE